MAMGERMGVRADGVRRAVGLRKASAICDRVQVTVLIQCALQREQLWSLPKFKQATQCEVSTRVSGEMQFVLGYEKRCVLAKRSGFHFNESLATIRIERQDVVAKAIPLCLRDMLHPFSQIALADIAPVSIARTEKRTLRQPDLTSDCGTRSQGSPV